MRILNRLTAAWCMLASSMVAIAGPPLFTDDFTRTAAPQWGNESGNWAAKNGSYSATLPNNNPQAISSLPFELRNFIIETDILQIQDGGVWLRLELDENNAPHNGILLVTGGFTGTHGGFYWHRLTDGAFSGPTNITPNNLFIPGVDSVHLRIVVKGDTYRVYMNRDSEPVTTLTDENHCVGRVAVYDFSVQSFDNVAITQLADGEPDLNGDDVVNTVDLLALLADWGPCDPNCCFSDLNLDGIVDSIDLLQLLGDWG